MPQNIFEDCSSENICSLMKSVRFVGLFPVCAWLYFVNSVDLSSQTGRFLLDSWWWWWWWWWYNLMGSFSGSPLYWARNPKVQQVQSSSIKMKAKGIQSLLCGLKFSSETENMFSLVGAPMNHHTPCKMDSIVDRNFSTVLCVPLPKLTNHRG
jgi:hypothetical protein